MILAFLACGEPDPFADTACSRYWPADVPGAEWRFSAVEDGEYGPEGWRTVRTAGAREWQDTTAFVTEFVAELDFETVDSYRISGTEAWACDAEGSWFLGRDQSTEWVDGDQEGTDTFTLVLEEPILLVPTSPVPGDAWESEVQAHADLGTTGELDGSWHVASSVNDEGAHDGTPTVRIERAETFQSSTETTSAWYGEGLGPTLDEGRWELVELTW